MTEFSVVVPVWLLLTPWAVVCIGRIWPTRARFMEGVGATFWCVRSVSTIVHIVGVFGAILWASFIWVHDGVSYPIIGRRVSDYISLCMVMGIAMYSRGAENTILDYCESITSFILWPTLPISRLMTGVCEGNFYRWKRRLSVEVERLALLAIVAVSALCVGSVSLEVVAISNPIDLVMVCGLFSSYLMYVAMLDFLRQANRLSTLLFQVLAFLAPINFTAAFAVILILHPDLGNTLTSHSILFPTPPTT